MGTPFHNLTLSCRTFLLFSLVLSLWAGASSARENPPPVVISERAPSKRLAWQKKIEQVLKKKVSFHFVDMPLSEAIERLRNLSGLNFVLDPQTDAGDTPINLRIQNMTLRLALKWVLKLCDLDYTVRDGAIFITSPDRLVGEVELRVYYVGDLVREWKRTAEMGIDIDEKGEIESVPGGGFFEKPDDNPSSLAEMFQTRVRPDSWAPETSVEQFQGVLVVMQRPEVHRQIAKLLAGFRGSRAPQVRVAVKLLLLTNDLLKDVRGTGAGALTVDALQKLDAALKAGKSAKLVDAAELTTLSSRRRYVYLARRRRAKDAKGKLSEAIDHGMVLVVEPAVSSDDGTIHAALKFTRLSKLRKPREVRVDTKIVVRPGGSMLVAAASPNGASKRTLVVLVTLEIVKAMDAAPKTPRDEPGE